MFLGAIEAGGTKFVCAVSTLDLEVVERVSFSTRTPEETMADVFAFFDQYELQAIGIGSFGPIDVNPKSDTYGFVLNTPKPGWAGYDFLGALKGRYGVPAAWTTDVNAAALGELGLGAAKGLESCLYLTVGTGIGGGAVVKGELLEGFGHPEMGHILVKRHPNDEFKGFCPFHGDCLEGLAAGPAIEGRVGKKAFELAKDDPAWEIEAYYLAQALMNYILIISPERIILGGGVMKQEQLFGLVKKQLVKLLAGYVDLPDLEGFIVPPLLGDDAGITGALLLAAKCCTRKLLVQS